MQMQMCPACTLSTIWLTGCDLSVPCHETNVSCLCLVKDLVDGIWPFCPLPWNKCDLPVPCRGSGWRGVTFLSLAMKQMCLACALSRIWLTGCDLSVPCHETNVSRLRAHRQKYVSPVHWQETGDGGVAFPRLGGLWENVWPFIFPASAFFYIYSFKWRLTRAY